MQVEITISAVDGETSYSIVTSSARVALGFLNSFDHEGSSISLCVQSGSEEVYNILNRLAERE